MTTAQQHHRRLFDLLLEGKLSHKEAEELMQWISEGTDPELSELMQQHLQSGANNPPDEASVSIMQARLPQILQQEEAAPVFSLNRTWVRYAAAIMIVLVGAFALTSRNEKPIPIAANTQPTSLSSDVAPGEEGAILTLSDGRTILLDSIGNGTIAAQGNTNIELKNGSLVYQHSGEQFSAMDYNTVTTPNGRQIQLSLADGSKVWLNAGSSLRFPMAFTAKERVVEITGEAYFEVAKDRSKPFRVLMDKGVIEVLGTHFNVNSYANEKSIKTTLLEGSVKVSATGVNDRHTIIKPGQQAQISNELLDVVSNVDMGRVMAWKNGFFAFQDATLEEVMRQLERWYDIDVSYENGAPPGFEFVGKIGRDLTLKNVLRGLEVSGVRFRLEGKKLTVLR